MRTDHVKKTFPTSVWSSFENFRFSSLVDYGFAILSDHIYRLFVDFILHPILSNDTLQHDCVDLDYIDLVNCSSSCTSCVILCHY